MPAARLIGVGVFVVGGLVIFALGLFMIGDRRFLFDDLFMVNAEFAQVAGLRDGAAVRVNGMEAGEVLDIAIPPSPAGRFRVRMRLREELRPLVRADSVASIRTDGIVGGRYVQIEAGSESSPAVDDGAVLKAREPFDFADLLDQGTKTIESVNVTINELRSHLNEVVGLVRVTVTNANEVVASVSDDLTSISRSGRRLSDETIRIVEGIRAGRGRSGSWSTMKSSTRAWPELPLKRSRPPRRHELPPMVRVRRLRACRRAVLRMERCSRLSASFVRPCRVPATRWPISPRTLKR